jgi:type VI secretion system secreted protein Hcp
MWLEGNEGGAPEVKGETQDVTYKANNAFEPMSFSLGASNPSSIGSAAGGSGSGKVSISDFSIMKVTDSASANLFLACCNGGHYDKAHVVLRRASGDAASTGTVYLQYDFFEVFVDNIQWSGSTGGSDTPTESISFSFGAMQVTYSPQQATGDASSQDQQVQWSVVLNNNSTNVS